MALDRLVIDENRPAASADLVALVDAFPGELDTGPAVPFGRATVQPTADGDETELAGPSLLNLMKPGSTRSIASRSQPLIATIRHRPVILAMGRQSSDLGGIDSKYRRLMVHRRSASTSRPRSSVRVAGADATSPKAVQDGGRIYAQVFADPCERPAEGVEVDGGVDLIDGEAAATRRHAVPTEAGADCPTFDAEPVAQFVHRCSGLVPGDEFLDLVGVELACPPWFGSVYGRWSRCGGVRQLPKQGLQGFYLAFCVVVSSPKVRNLSQLELSALGQTPGVRVSRYPRA